MHLLYWNPRSPDLIQDFEELYKRNHYDYLDTQRHVHAKWAIQMAAPKSLTASKMQKNALLFLKLSQAVDCLSTL